MARKKIWDISTSINTYITKLASLNLNNMEIWIKKEENNGNTKYNLGSSSTFMWEKYMVDSTITQSIRSMIFLGIITPSQHVDSVNSLLNASIMYKVMNFMDEDDIYKKTIKVVESKFNEFLDSIDSYEDYYSQDDFDENNDNEDKLNEQGFWNSLSFAIVKNVYPNHETTIDYFISTDVDKNSVLSHYDHIAKKYSNLISANTIKKINRIFDTYSLPLTIATNKNKSIIATKQSSNDKIVEFGFKTEQLSLILFLDKYMNYSKSSKIIVPVYQRSYRWDEKKLTTLIDDIESINEDSFHSVGTILLKSRKDGSSIIDGQQRITTLLLILKSLYHIAKYNFWQMDQLLDEMFKVGEDGYNRIYKSFTKIKGGADFVSAKEIFNSTTEGIKEHKTQLSIVFLAAISTLSKKLTNQIQFSTFSKKLLSNTIVVINIYESDVNEYFLFEKLNTLSLPLNVLELLKNNIFSRYTFDNESRESELQKEFEDKVLTYFQNNKKQLVEPLIKKFIIVLSRTYKIHKTNKDSEYQIYKEIIDNVYMPKINKVELLNDDLKIDEFNSLIEYIQKDIILYLNISDTNRYISTENVLHPFADYLFSFSKRESYYPFLMRTFKYWMDNHSQLSNSNRISEINKIRKVLHALETYEIRFKFVSNTGQSLGKEMESTLDFDYIPTPKELLDKFTKIKDDSSHRLPTLNSFIASIKTRPIIKNKDAIILCNRIENYISNKGISFNIEENIKIVQKKGKSFKLSREHFIPQEPKEWNLDNTQTHRDNINFIGNTLLVSTIKNSVLSNKTKNDKIKILKGDDVVPSTFLFKGCVVVPKNSELIEKAKETALSNNVECIELEDDIRGFIYLPPIREDREFDYNTILERTNAIAEITSIIWKDIS